MRTLALVLVLLIAEASVATAQGAKVTGAPTATPPAAPPPTTPTPDNVTEVHGKLPDMLAGVWLVTLNTPTQQQGIVSNWHVYRFEHRSDRWGLQRYERPKASPLDTAFAEAKQHRAAFEPSATSIKAIKAMLPEMKLLPAFQTFRIVALRAGDQIPADPPPPAAAKDAKFSVEILDQTTQSTTISAVSFYAKDVQPDRITGDTYAMTITATGFSVVPIELSGTFKMYRLE